MAPLPSVLVADYVDHAARVWVSAAFSSARRETAERLSAEASLLRAEALKLCACPTGLLEELPEYTSNGGG